MEDIEFDAVLGVLENSVRRKIIKRLSQRPSYPSQLSKELGLGQPLVAKHLTVMEAAKVVTSSLEGSPSGPDRRIYSLAKSI
jgi:predicted transcriptional regulator